jgi:aspartate-semialdehyde dehydrogenase
VGHWYTRGVPAIETILSGAMSREAHPLTVAVVGATGVVGRTMIQVLSERHFPVGDLRLLASGRSAGSTVSADGRTLTVGEATPEAFEGVDIALFSAGSDISRQLAPEAAARGATVIDNSNAWRMEPNVPLIVSQVNPEDGEWHEGIIANPNCSTMQLVPVLMALRDTVGLERVIVDTYQSVSGTGAEALAEMESQIRAHVAGEAKVASVYPHPIAFNVLPEIDAFLDNGYSREEWKVVTESRKILHLPDLRVSCTAVRVPVFVSHSRRPRRGEPSRRCRAWSSWTIPRPTSIRSLRRPRARMRSTSVGSERTRRLSQAWSCGS